MIFPTVRTSIHWSNANKTYKIYNNDDIKNLQKCHIWTNENKFNSMKMNRDEFFGELFFFVEIWASVYVSVCKPSSGRENILKLT